MLYRKDLIIRANRQRRDFDPEALTELSNSISRLGLFHPLVVREEPEGFTLVAGERRLRALETLWIMGLGCRHNGVEYPPNTLPYITLGELDPLAAEEAELDENLRRRDLTWQERSEALGRLHALRTEQATIAGTQHKIADTLREIDTSDYGTDRKALLLAGHLDNPIVAGAKSEKEAFKLLQRAEEREKNQALAADIGMNYSSASHTLVNVNCLDWLRDCPDGQFDVILTDPPYGMGADTFGDAAGTLPGTDHQYDDSTENWQILMSDFCPETFRVAKAQAHAYIFCDFDNFHELKLLMEKAGWYVFRTPLLSYKLGSGRVPLPEHGPRRQYETILYAIKGKKTVTGIYSDVLPNRLEENLFHGANKSVELFTDLLKRSVRPGDKVLDAFAGTGTIFPAAHAVKVYATGLELDPGYYGVAIKRLNSVDDSPEML